MKLGFNEATALECKGQSLMADLEMCEKYGFDYIEIRFDCVKDYLKEHTLVIFIRNRSCPATPRMQPTQMRFLFP